VGRLIDRLDDDKLCDFLICAGSELAPDQYPAKETALCERLPELLKSLPFCGRQFDDRLSLLTSWLNHFPNVPAAENRLGQWRTLRAMLVALRDVSPPKPRMGFLKRAGKSPVDDAMGKKLAETVWRAMPDTEYPDDVTGDEKMRCLRQLVAVLLGNSKSLPDPIWWKIQTYYRQRNWPSAKQSPLVPISSKKTYGAQSSQNRSRRLRELAIFTALGLALLVLGLVVYQAGIGVAYKDTDPPPDTAQTEPAPTHKPRVAPNQHNATAKTTPTKAAPTTEQIAAQKPRVAVNEHNAPTKVTPTDRNLVRLSANSEVDAEICKAILRWNLWCTWRKDEKMIASKLASDDVNERWVAAVFARQQHFDLPDELINALGQPSVHVRRETRAALVQLAGNADFGPADNDDEIAVADAITRWTLWRKWRTDLKQIAGKLASADMNECWVAAVLARQERLLLPDEFIKLLTHPSVHVRREARRALVQLAGNVDFGPNANANAAQIQEAAKQWSEWRAEKIKQSSTARQAPPQKENTTVTLTYKALPEAIDPRLPSNPRPVEFVTYDTDTATATPAFTLYMPASVKQESGTKASVLTPVNSNSTLPPERLVLNNDTHQPKKRAVEFQWFKPRASDTDLIRKLRGCVLAINTGTQQRSFVALTNKVEQPILHFDDKGKATVDIGKEHAAAGTNILQYHIYNATVRQGEYVYTFEGTLGGEDAKLTPNGLAPPISASVKVELTGHFLYFRIRTDDAMLKKDLKEGKVTVTATFERTVEAANAPPLRVEDITIGVPQTNTGSARLDVSEATCHPELQWLIG
jgi:hypothetical protein